MGRPYADELAELSDTYRQALEDSIDGLTGFVNGSLRSPLRVVGSGGSATACIFASILHEQSTYMVSRHATPLEQLDACSSPGTSVLLISAGGNNKDIIAAFERASSLDRNALGILCSSGGRGKLSRMCASYPSVYVQDADIRNKDGFLATNSLLAA
ncbi:MAG: hypothetical protein J4F28_09525, partial [Nitrosopumilaceae archaeon]|nr:hypothetical protein [Nitrosopumilaceae archaeon]